MFHKEGEPVKRIVLSLVCILLLCGAVCASGEELFPLWPDLAEEVTRSDLGLPKKTRLPVFSAPLENAWRGAKGKAAVSVEEPFSVLGNAQGGQWLLIDYPVSKKERRIGWISRPEKYESGESSSLYLGRYLYRVRENAVLTDDPENSRREIRKLLAGETVIVMGTLDAGGTNWLYAEAEVNGQPAWGFVAAEKLEPAPIWTAEGDRLIVREGLTSIGVYDGGDADETWDSEDENTEEMLNLSEEESGGKNLIRAGEFWADSQNLEALDMSNPGIRQIVLPSTLEYIGMESFYIPSGLELVLSGHPYHISDEAFQGRLSKGILSADYTGVCPPFSCSWEVEEGNPAYVCRDGILFSADSRVLWSYDFSRDDLHYDVPAGTEEIADNAFNDGSMTLPLQTVSLPIGLRRIGAYAFSGCGRLHSLTVPLTVTDLAPTAFYHCVSLERLSLPPGLKVSQDDYALHEDLSRYMGDNGATLSEPRRENNFGVVEQTTPVTVSVWLSGENGEGPVPVYASPDAEAPVREKASGISASYSAVSNGRARIWDYGDVSWISLANILPRGTDAFFSVSGVSPSAEGLEALNQQGLETWKYAWIDDEEMTVVFTLPYAGGDDDRQAVLPIRQTCLYRKASGETRIFALLWAEQPGQAVRLLDAPGGASAGWTYRGEQAEVLETDGDWARIRTVRLTGWIQREKLVVVEPEPAGEDFTPVLF